MNTFLHGYCDFDDTCFLCIHYNWQMKQGNHIWVETRNHPLSYGNQKHNLRLSAWSTKYNIPTDHMCVSARSAQAEEVKVRAARTDLAQNEQLVSLPAFMTILIKSYTNSHLQDTRWFICVCYTMHFRQKMKPVSTDKTTTMNQSLF